MSFYEEADKESRRTLALIDDVLAEIADEARQRWFVDRFVHLDTIQAHGLDFVDIVRAFSRSAVERACEAGWPKYEEKKPQHRIARGEIGKVLEPIPDHE
ncbi:hypothetical protein [Streptomyces europaeiscabiei]|uniref:hypothetical protein n=1 Tax=Streptomyces europaeiscabiei TaxID=146819 RepID=UPI0029AC53EE|nr:hypothetical protein [Streptomyces europaeiscabiei]MDX2762918.1 hypothetical protein [Streptomyces europaeiscabiei]